MQQKISYEVFSETGEHHNQKGIENQDSINIVTNNNYSFIILSDGAGSSKFAKESSETTVQSASKYCFNNSKDAVLDCKKFANSLIFDVQHNLDKKAKEIGTILSEMICTLVVLAIDNDNKNYFTIHVGDGLVATDEKIISNPENGSSKHHTYFVNSPSVFKHLRVTCGTFSESDKFFVSTDGCFEGCNFVNEILEKIKDEVFSSKDDITYCKIQFDIVE